MEHARLFVNIIQTMLVCITWKKTASDRLQTPSHHKYWYIHNNAFKSSLHVLHVAPKRCNMSMFGSTSNEKHMKKHVTVFECSWMTVSKICIRLSFMRLSFTKNVGARFQRNPVFIPPYYFKCLRTCQYKDKSFRVDI